jgi:hypothetical protein
LKLKIFVKQPQPNRRIINGVVSTKGRNSCYLQKKWKEPIFSKNELLKQEIHNIRANNVFSILFKQLLVILIKYLCAKSMKQITTMLKETENNLKSVCFQLKHFILSSWYFKYDAKSFLGISNNLNM